MLIAFITVDNRGKLVIRLLPEKRKVIGSLYAGRRIPYSAPERRSKYFNLMLKSKKKKKKREGKRSCCDTGRDREKKSAGSRNRGRHRTF